MNSYKFIKDWSAGGTTIRKGVAIRGEFIATDTTISLKGSDYLKDIPLDHLEGFEDIVYAKKQKTKKTKEEKIKKTADEEARLSSRIDLLANSILDSEDEDDE